MKKKLLVLAVSAALVTMMAGCTVSDYIAAGVKNYCELPEETRLVNREAVSLAVSPHRVSVECN